MHCLLTFFLLDFYIVCAIRKPHMIEGKEAIIVILEATRFASWGEYRVYNMGLTRVEHRYF